jgi:hypothetical protein
LLRKELEALRALHNKDVTVALSPASSPGSSVESELFSCSTSPSSLPGDEEFSAKTGALSIGDSGGSRFHGDSACPQVTGIGS